MTPAKKVEKPEKPKAAPKKATKAEPKPKSTKPKTKATKTSTPKQTAKKSPKQPTKQTKKQVLKKQPKKAVRTKKQGKHKKTVEKKVKAEKVTAAPKKPVKYMAGAKEVNIYSISGKSKSKIKLPEAFDESHRPDLIRRAVKAAQANRRQPYGPSPMSGMSHSTKTWGKGRGAARVQRLVDGRRAVESPNNVGGRRAHPPTVEKVWAEKINKKERRKARRVALAAISDTELVVNRGHKFDNKISLPLIFEDDFETVKQTKKAIEVFQKIGIYDDVIRARNGKHIRPGKGKGRGRKYKTPKSILIVALKKDELEQGIGNLTGVDLVTPNTLSVEDLAPGGDPGRLTIITESALKLMGNW